MNKDFFSIDDSPILNDVLESVQTLVSNAMAAEAQPCFFVQATELPKFWGGIIMPIELDSFDAIGLQNVYQDVHDLFSERTLFLVACKCYSDVHKLGVKRDIAIGTALVHKSRRFKRTGIFIYWCRR